MSFSITAAGTVDQVRAQVNAVKFGAGDTSQAEAVRAFLLSELDQTSTTDYPTNQRGLLIEASGHHDQSTRSVRITMTPLWLPREAPEDDA